MSLRLKTKEERREARLMFYKDDVFVIAHKALQQIPCSLSVEEVFYVAERFAHFLMEYDISCPELVECEIRELSEDLDDPEDLFPILLITFVKLCALRKTYPEAVEVARALVPLCQRYGKFHDILGELEKAEHKLMVERGRTDLYHYELKSIAKEHKELEDARRTLNGFVNSALDCDTEVVKNVMVGFAKFNEDFGHQYDAQARALTQGYADKLSGREARKIEYHIDRVEQLNGVIETGAQVVHTLKNEDL
jgi:hypothetical protein